MLGVLAFIAFQKHGNRTPEKAQTRTQPEAAAATAGIFQFTVPAGFRPFYPSETAELKTAALERGVHHLRLSASGDPEVLNEENLTFFSGFRSSATSGSLLLFTGVKAPQPISIEDYYSLQVQRLNYVRKHAFNRGDICFVTLDGFLAFQIDLHVSAGKSWVRTYLVHVPGRDSESLSINVIAEKEEEGRHLAAGLLGSTKIVSVDSPRVPFVITPGKAFGLQSGDSQARLLPILWKLFVANELSDLDLQLLTLALPVALGPQPPIKEVTPPISDFRPTYALLEQARTRSTKARVNFNKVLENFTLFFVNVMRFPPAELLPQSGSTNGLQIFLTPGQWAVGKQRAKETQPINPRLEALASSLETIDYGSPEARAQDVNFLVGTCYFDALFDWVRKEYPNASTNQVLAWALYNYHQNVTNKQGIQLNPPPSHYVHRVLKSYRASTKAKG